MTTDWKALCTELAEVLAEEYGVQREFDRDCFDLLEGPLLGSGAIELLSRVCTELSQPEPEEPTEEEILNLGNDVMGNCLPCDPDLLLAFARAVLSADRILAQAAARKLRQSLQE